MALRFSPLSASSAGVAASYYFKELPRIDRHQAQLDLTMRCSGRHLSSRRLQGQALARTGCGQQAARRLRAAADRER
jgi:hypothetical protein